MEAVGWANTAVYIRAFFLKILIIGEICTKSLLIFLHLIWYIFSRGSYTDRKKKIIQEWNKTNKSPRPPETLTSADPLRQPAPSYLSAAGHHELFQHPYNPYANVKDEPLRADYPYYGYPDLVNPYVHMGRKEKRKKHDSLPGGQTLTRDERKVINHFQKKSKYQYFTFQSGFRHNKWVSPLPARTSSTCPWMSSTTCCPSTS